MFAVIFQPYGQTLALYGSFATLLAKLQVVVYRVSERLLQFFDARALEGDYFSKVDNLAVEEPRPIIELDVSRVALVLQHTFIPPVRLRIPEHVEPTIV